MLISLINIVFKNLKEKYMLFDLPHILYMVFSGIVTAGILISASFLIIIKKGAIPLFFLTKTKCCVSINASTQGEFK